MTRFGLFIHWGMSSLLMDGEWVMENHRINAAEFVASGNIHDALLKKLKEASEARRSSSSG